MCLGRRVLSSFAGSVFRQWMEDLWRHLAVCDIWLANATFATLTILNRYSYSLLSTLLKSPFLSINMLQLHVWGSDSIVSVISPECLASSWLLNMILTPDQFEIITSSNTNISDIHKLPVLIDDDIKYQGYVAISRYIEEISKEHKPPVNEVFMDSTNLINMSLLNLNLTKIEYINQYNLFMNVKNYEKFTRKLFQKYFPFPMMYNQPLKFYNNAQAQIKLLGLASNKTSFFSLAGAQTETVNDEYSDDEENEMALSALHERKLLAKSKEKEMLKETRNSLRCLHLINEYLEFYVKIFEDMNKSDADGIGSEYGYIFDKNKISTSELLLYSYIYSLTYEELPDKFVANYLQLKYPKMSEFIREKTHFFNENLANINFRSPCGIEAPTLVNEIKYLTGFIEY